ncbi:putative galacturonosyltransferase 4 [Ananas comosus]|uniref:Putative galacturonosyltransferase 4 n=1 Tax=Ananas comosus TaxID=4615 RepID=A0A199VD76_ANACO|nr:putative galacturonosyltransferase 4 [Ananas comosus]
MATRKSKRRTVLGFLLLSVLAPIVLYTDRITKVSNSIPISDFGREIPNQVMPLILQEPVRIVHSKSNADAISARSVIGFTALTANCHVFCIELPRGISDEHKSRVLSATYDEGKQLERDSSDEKVDATDQEKERGLDKVGDQEHKSRALSVMDEGIQSEKEGIIEQVVRSANLAEGEKNMENNEGTQSENKGMIEQAASRESDKKPEMEEKNKEKKIEAPTFPWKQGNKDGKPSELVPSQVRTRKHRRRSTNNDRSGATTLPDVRVRQLKDQLVKAKVYLGLCRSNTNFVRELQARIRDVERALGDATKDSELHTNSREKLRAMEETLAKGKQIQENCSAVINKLQAILHSTEEQLNAHKKQAIYLTQLAAKTLPKGLHCLPLRLTTEFYISNVSQEEFPTQEKLEDPKLYHYALFSDNVLAAAVVVNSTVLHAKNPENHVFHIVTDRLNYAAMKMWFLANPPGKATIQIRNVEEFTWLNSSYSPVLKQLGSKSMIDYYFKTHRAISDENLKFRNPKYLSILNHLRFYLPEIFPKLDKVLFLDDDVVVQRDLTALWSIDLKGKVNGAVETCGESFHRFDRYLNFSNPLIAENFNPRACGWAYGMNIFDLVEWRKQNITDVYHSWQKLNQDRLLWKLGTLPAGLVTFWNRTLPLDRSWHVLGLGYNPNIRQEDIKKAAVIHYNGNMKPWLEIGLPKYRSYWSKYVDFNQVFLRECNVNF